MLVRAVLRAVMRVWGLSWMLALALGLQVDARAQGPAAAAKGPSPIAAQFRAQKVVTAADGAESLEDASNVAIGDVIEYGAQYRNISRRRLLQVDFGIPIPLGTSYVESSARPEGARRVKLDARRQQMVWRVERLEPGEAVEMRMRVRIDPDPMLTPVPAQPRKPELRRGAP